VVLLTGGDVANVGDLPYSQISFLSLPPF
jgi:hypothetical protein